MIEELSPMDEQRTLTLCGLIPLQMARCRGKPGGVKQNSTQTISLHTNDPTVATLFARNGMEEVN